MNRFYQSFKFIRTFRIIRIVSRTGARFNGLGGPRTSEMNDTDDDTDFCELAASFEFLMNDQILSWTRFRRSKTVILVKLK